MDLSELLSTDRILCKCDLHSRKKVLQTLAEALSRSLLPLQTIDNDDTQSESNGTIGSLANKILKNLPKNVTEDDKDTLSEMNILDAFISRERLGSTCLDHGFALPHCRIGVIEKPVAALITLENGIDFNATANQAVDLVLGLLVPEQCNDTHLKILATLARRFSDAEFRENLRAHTRPAELYDYAASLAPIN